MRLAWPFPLVKAIPAEESTHAITVIDDGFETEVQMHIMAYLSDGRPRRMIDIWYAISRGPLPDLRSNIRPELAKLVRRGLLDEGWNPSRAHMELEFVYWTRVREEQEAR